MLKLTDPPHRFAAVIIALYAMLDIARMLVIAAMYGLDGPAPSRYWGAAAGLVALLSIRGIWRGERPHWLLCILYWMLASTAFVVGLAPLRSPHPRLGTVVAVGMPLVLGTLIWQFYARFPWRSPNDR